MIDGGVFWTKGRHDNAEQKGTMLFFLELNEPARPAAARSVSHDMGGRAAGGSALRTERRGQNRRIPSTASICRFSHGGN